MIFKSSKKVYYKKISKINKKGQSILIPLHQFSKQPHQEKTAFNQFHQNNTHTAKNNPSSTNMSNIPHYQQQHQPPPSLMSQQHQKHEHINQESTFSIPGSEQFTSNPLLNIKPISELIPSNSKSHHGRSLNEAGSHLSTNSVSDQASFLNAQKEIKFEEPRKNREPIDYNESILLNKHFNNGNIRNNETAYNNERNSNWRQNGFNVNANYNNNNSYNRENNGRYFDKNYSNQRDNYNGNGGRDSRANFYTKPNRAPLPPSSRGSNEHQTRLLAPEKVTRDENTSSLKQELKSSEPNENKTNGDSSSNKQPHQSDQDEKLSQSKLEDTPNKSDNVIKGEDSKKEINDSTDLVKLSVITESALNIRENSNITTPSEPIENVT